MPYSNLRALVDDLESQQMLVRIRQEVDPNLEMAAIHRKVFSADGPAILFEKVKGSAFPALSNLFGSMERCNYMFRKEMPALKQLLRAKSDPESLMKKPLNAIALAKKAFLAKPKKGVMKSFREIEISELPMIKSWPDDGGAFITLPQVFSQWPPSADYSNGNLGMYRVQLSGNEYLPNQEIGLHYQIHRGIGVHHQGALAAGKAMPISIFVGGPPAHTLSAVMPLPEGLSELNFAGVLAGRRFRYAKLGDHLISLDADFVITGYVQPGKTKPEGPFGDHLGYYSLTHDFPVLDVHKVWVKKDAIWPFTVVGRPPQEDSFFGKWIHELTGGVLQQSLPGVKEVNAVDAAGVHPLLLAKGSERYTPFIEEQAPQEILTQANAILGFGQLSLAKYLFIANAEPDCPSCQDERAFLLHMLERLNPQRDIHFQTKTSIDTLDYSGTALNHGSKVVFAARGPKIRELATKCPDMKGLSLKSEAKMAAPGILLLDIGAWEENLHEGERIGDLIKELLNLKVDWNSLPLIVLVDQPDFCAANFENFLWVCFTRSNPAFDIYGTKSQSVNKHWGAELPLLIDARIKTHHAPALIDDPIVEQRISGWFEKGGALHNLF